MPQHGGVRSCQLYSADAEQEEPEQPEEQPELLVYWHSPGGDSRECVARGIEDEGLRCVARGMPAEGRECVARGLQADELQSVAL